MKTSHWIALCCGLFTSCAVGAQNLDEVAAQPYQDRPVEGILSAPSLAGEAARGELSTAASETSG
ncbi:MAG TPA: hypothetical protein PKO06_10840, partial [Candidatus Ozemobacteraceae bacterium]|nr:hypothetical protein [Candidatus Ozemobacteraceae bacterium]